MKVLAILVLLMVCAGCGRIPEDSQPDLPAPSQAAVQPISNNLCVSSIAMNGAGSTCIADLAKPGRVCWWIWSAYRRAAKSGDERLPEFFKATFPATDQTNNAEFKVTIQRDDLSYRFSAKLAAMWGDSTPARLAGRCSILDGRGFLTGEREASGYVKREETMTKLWPQQ